MKIAYFDAGSGISGDMTVGALLDAGAPRISLERLREALSLLPVEGYRLCLERVNVGGVCAASFQVHIARGVPHEAEQIGHGSGHGHEHGQGHAHGAGHGHDHGLSDTHEHGSQPAGGGAHHRHDEHVHRDWRSIRTMIEHAGAHGLSRGTVEHSIAIFSVLAEAEGKVHGVAPADVHFHEVGAIDSIVDIVATAWCLDELEIEACFVGALPSGSGFVDTEHGRLPVPAPATALLLRNFDVIAGDGEGELVTPTGAAILRALALPVRPSMRLTSVGTGAGTRRLADRANVLRVLLGEHEASSDQEILTLECDVDDMTPAALAHVAERLRSDGALDVSIVPTIGKKGRTAMRLTVLCEVEDARRLGARILGESTTIGIRYRACGRIVLARRIDVVATPFGSIALKVVVRPDGGETAEPELDDLARAAITHDRPLREVRLAALAAWEKQAKTK